MEPGPRVLDFGEILEGALALPSNEQARLCLVLQKLMGAGTASSAALPATPPAPIQADIDEGWFRALRQEAGWSQLQLLEDALMQPHTEEATRVLELARESLLRDQPALAVRRSVVDLATRHPVGVLLGAAGLCIAIIGLVRFVFTALF
jgi:hypothetical protein